MCFWGIFYLKSSVVQCSVGRLFRRQHGLNQVNMLAGLSVVTSHSKQMVCSFIHYRVADIILLV